MSGFHAFTSCDATIGPGHDQLTETSQFRGVPIRETCGERPAPSRWLSYRALDSWISVVVTASGCCNLFFFQAPLYENLALRNRRASARYRSVSHGTVMVLSWCESPTLLTQMDGLSYAYASVSIEHPTLHLHLH